MLYLRNILDVPKQRILWVVPTNPWITCRDPPSGKKQNTCMEFVRTALEAHEAAGCPSGAAQTADFLLRGFERAESVGKVYRIDPAVTPTKFMDATLNRREIEVLRGCAGSILRGRGRVAAITNDGALTFADGSCVALPWATDAADAAGGSTGGGSAASSTTFVHCTAGAFEFSASAAEGAW